MTTEADRQARRAYRALPFGERRAVWRYARRGELAPEPRLRPHVAWIARRSSDRWWLNPLLFIVGYGGSLLIANTLAERDPWSTWIGVVTGGIVISLLSRFWLRPRLLKALELNAGAGSEDHVDAIGVRDRVPPPPP